jgi:hypothetical protein
LIEKLAAKRKKLVVVVLAINEEIGLQGWWATDSHDVGEVRVVAKDVEVTTAEKKKSDNVK